MSVIIVGTQRYGSVDRVPGLCYVTTTFFHWFFLPLFPVGSMIAFEGSEDGILILLHQSVRGLPIGLNLKSVLTGYLRGWLGGFVCFFFFFYWLIVSLDVGSALKLMQPLAIGFSLFFTVCGSAGVLFVLLTRRWWWIPAALALLVSSIGIWLLCSQWTELALQSSPSRWTSALIWQTLLLVLYCCTRFCDRASEARAVDLGAQLGEDAKSVRALLNGNTVTKRRRRSFDEDDLDEDEEQPAQKKPRRPRQDQEEGIKAEVSASASRRRKGREPPRRRRQDETAPPTDQEEEGFPQWFWFALAGVLLFLALLAVGVAVVVFLVARRFG